MTKVIVVAFLAFYAWYQVMRTVKKEKKPFQPPKGWKSCTESRRTRTVSGTIVLSRGAYGVG